jgi:hypothetical protein
MAQIEPLTAQDESLEPTPPRIRISVSPEAEPITVIQLFDAVRASDLKAVQRLIDSSINIASKDPEGDWRSPSCLEIAIANRQEEIASMLIRGGAKLEAVGSMLWDRVFYSVVNNELLQTADLLLEKVDQACCPVN